MNKDEALRLAFEALKQIDEAMPFPVAKLAQKVIKEALAQPEQDGKCKYCTDGCPACDARKLPEQPPYHHFVSDRFNIDPQTGNLNIGAVKKQEPVAWIDKMVIDVPNQLFYTTPHIWIGLTLDERIELAQDVDWAAGAYCEYAEKIEAKLKAKNVL